ncbi:MAG TPA: hypothetical protein VF170_11320 [Planctomycetaceae bacterium]
MNRFSLTLARLCSAIWVGAALLFVATSVTEQVHPSFDPATKDTLALIRFPWYYGTGATLLAVAFVAANFSGLAAWPRRSAALLLFAAIVLMAADHAFVYRPLREVLTPPGGGRGPAFERLHVWSERLNAAGFLLSATAAAVLCTAREERKATGSVEP